MQSEGVAKSYSIECFTCYSSELTLICICLLFTALFFKFCFSYRLVSKSNSVKFELEVVYIDELKVIGIRRKRVRGDSWAYKRIMDQVLALTAGVAAPLPSITTPLHAKPPLQTMV